ncbi:MetS family NSS transporter small subunit [Aminipila sp.]|uniref:MetS family NSS transporter small subunit n=1 Tax=Aminipila sp. TaxID=2060095 RepID=UPI003FA487DC
MVNHNFRNYWRCVNKQKTMEKGGKPLMTNQAILFLVLGMTILYGGLAITIVISYKNKDQ